MPFGLFSLELSPAVKEKVRVTYVKSIAETPPGKLSTASRVEEFKLEQTHKRVTGRTGE